MRNLLHSAFSVLLVIVSILPGLEAITASSLHPPSSGRGAATRQADDPNHPADPPGFIGYAGDVLTYHYTASRQGQNTLESILTTSNVNSSSFEVVRIDSRVFCPCRLAV